MGAACASCGGVGFGEIEPGAGYRDTGQPCPKCNADAESRPAGSFAPKAAATKTGEWVDAPGESSWDDSPQSPQEAGFSPAQVAAQQAADAAAEAREGR